jgi:hypothetical protein
MIMMNIIKNNVDDVVIIKKINKYKYMNENFNDFPQFS